MNVLVVVLLKLFTTKKKKKKEQNTTKRGISINIHGMIITIIIVMINLKINYSIIFLGIYFLTLLYQIKIFNLQNPSDCLKAFKVNNLSGLLVFLGFFILAIDAL